MNTYRDIESRINTLVELSSMCRGEWCRLLEPDMDELDGELHDYLKSGEVDERFCLAGISDRIRQGYGNLSHDILE